MSTTASEPQEFGETTQYPTTPAMKKPRKPFEFTEARKKAFFEHCRPALMSKRGVKPEEKEGQKKSRAKTPRGKKLNKKADKV
jgi:hypothetical protein